jgi:hypothetical protein
VRDASERRAFSETQNFGDGVSVTKFEREFLPKLSNLHRMNVMLVYLFLLSAALSNLSFSMTLQGYPLQIAHSAQECGIQKREAFTVSSP